MTLGELLNGLGEVDGFDSLKAVEHLHNHEVVFDTSDRANLYLLSVYLSDDGKIHKDIGDADE